MHQAVKKPVSLQGKFFDAVVKVYCIHTEPNYSLPWQRKRQFSSTSSGFMVKNEQGQRCLLTNAHSVEYHTQVSNSHIAHVAVRTILCTCQRIAKNVQNRSSTKHLGHVSGSALDTFAEQIDPG